MKLPRGLDADKLKQFFFVNVEKIVFGVSMFLVALFLYGSIRQTPYEKTPDNLRESITKAKDNIQRENDIKPEDRPAKPRFVEVAQRAQDTVPIEPFRFATIFNRGDKEIGTKRGEPEYLAVRELEVTSGVAPFALKNPDRAASIVATSNTANGVNNPTNPAAAQAGATGVARPGAATAAKKPTPAKGGKGGLGSFLNPGGEGAQPAMPGGGEGLAAAAQGGAPVGPRGVQASADSIVEGVRWVCVTGLVPYKDQREKFYNEFNSAQYSDPLKDDPYWIGYLVERAEVSKANVKDPKKWKWEKISVNYARDFATTWAARAGDVVDPAYIDENLTFPLGPLLERNWGKEVTHSKIPLLDLTQRGAMSAGTATTEGDSIGDVGRKTEEDDITFLLKKRQDQIKRGDPGMNAPRTVAPRSAAAPATRGNLPRGYGGGEGGGYPMSRMPGGGDGGYGSRVQPRMLPQQGGGGAAEPQDVEYLLFRFFDFTVEEGKQYGYRVQLILANPNEGIRPQYLKDGNLAKDSYKLSPVSEPSSVASVSGYNYLLAGKVKAGEKASDEPKVNMIAVQLDPKMGTKAVYEMRPKKPGDKDDAKRPLTNIERGQVIKFNANVDVVHPITRHVEEKEVGFNSNMVLLDIKGGERFSTNFSDRDTTPGEVLFMDANGVLHAQAEAADEPDYLAEAEYLRMMEEAKKAKSAAPLGGGLPGGDGGSVPTRGRGRGEGS